MKKPQLPGRSRRLAFESLERRELLASLQPVPNWGASGVPSTLSMYIYVPNHVAPNPPVMVLCHYWGAKAGDVFAEASNGGLVAAADQYGFIIVCPQTSNPDGSGRGWDANSAASLMHNGGGETQGIAEMVQYTIKTFHADANRVYVTGCSSGAMMTETLLATYPDVFKAGVEFAGVPAGAWAAGNPNPGGWSTLAASGQVTNSAQGWGDIARAMDPGYTGPRPRVELWHGTADTTISYVNQTQAILQWTNVLALSSTPTLTTTVTINGNQYTRQEWLDSLGNLVLDAWSETNGPHGTDALFDATYEIPFLNLNQVGFGALSSAQDNDIGSPSPAGSSSYNADTNIYTVAGGGSGVGGASDQFNYLSQSNNGYGSITACVSSETNTSPAAQAGVMFRDSTAANAAYAYAFVTPANNVEFATRSANGVSSSYNVTVSVGTSPVWVRLTRSGSQFTAQCSLDGVNWTQVGTTQTVTMATNAQVGLAVSSSSNGTLCSSMFSGVQLQSWGAFTGNLDIGSPSPAGSGVYNVGTGTYTIAGGGADVWGASDQFHYLSTSFSGNGSITSRVNSETNTNASAKSGVMFRDSTAANAAYAFAWVSPSNNVAFETRAADGASSSYTVTASNSTSPVWVRLVRSGTSDNQFSAYYSLDGINWTQVGTTQTATMVANAQVGLAVTSHSNGALNTATIDNVLLDNSPPTVATAASASPSTAAGTVTNLAVLGASAGGETNLSYTWSLAGTPPAAVTFSANSTSAAKNTTATFAKPGTYNFIVTITDQGSLSTTSNVGVTVNQTLTGIAVTSMATTLAVGRTQQFSAVAFDQFGSAMATQPAFTWTVASGPGSINSSGLYTASAAGSATVQASSGGVTGTESVTVEPAFAAPTVATAASASAATTTPDSLTSTNLSVLGAYDGGESNLTYTWSLTGTPPAPVTFSANGANSAKNTTVTFTQAGVYNFVATIAAPNGLSVTSWVAVPVTFGLFNSSSDIGSPSRTGSLNFNLSSASYTVTAGGTDISGTSDQFRFNYESYSGNGQFTARVTSVGNTNASAKAGLMFRDSSAANGAFADMVVTPGSGVSFQWRSTDGGSVNSAQVTGVAATVWLRLVRTGNQFSGYYSTNDVNWTQVGATQSVTMPAAALAGLAVTSHNASSLTTAVIDTVTLSGTPMRGRATINAANTTFVADDGQLLRAPFTSTEWTGAIAESDLAMVKNLGFNAIHLYGESFDPNYPNSGSTAPGYAASRIDQIVQESIDLGLYVILTIGNGANNGDFNLQYDKAFWQFYAPRYANDTNVIYEIQNEPVSWGPSYVTSTSPSGAMTMEENCYSIIRAAAPSTPVLLFTYAVFTGTGGGNAALQDIQAFNQAEFGNANASWSKKNLAVAFHGYGDTTQTPIAVQTIIHAGYPAFMTEFTGGSWSGQYGGVNIQLTEALEQLQVSWATFEHVPPTGVASDVTQPTNFVDPVEASGLAWAPDYGTWPAPRGSYGNGSLPWTTTSNYVNNQLTGTLHIQAVNYDTGGQNVSYYDTIPGNQGGTYRPGDNVDIVPSTDIDGGYAIGDTANGDWFEYTIAVQQPGYYNLAVRYSNATSGAQVDVLSGGIDLTGSLTLPITGGLNNWSTFTIPIFLAQGQQVFHLGVPVGGYDINWLELTPIASGAVANGTYLVVNRNSGQAMQFDTTNNVVVQQPPATGSSVQQWVLQNLGAGQYEVTSAYNGSSWNANGSAGSALAMSGGWSLTGSEMFILCPTGDGFYNITTVNNDTNLDVLNGSVAGGAGVQQDTIASGANQEWAIIGSSDQVLPGGLVAFRDTAGKVQLSWNAASGAAGYNVKRSTTPGGPYTTIAADVTATSYVDTASQSTPYYYVVSAVNSVGKESLNSVEVAIPLPKALLKFNEGAGTTASDSTGNGWNGTLQNGATWSAGMSGDAVSLNGSNQYVSLPTGVVNGLTNFTISAWVNVAASPSWARIFDFGSGTSNYMFLCANPGGANALRFAINTGSGEQQINGTALALNTWTQVAVTMLNGVGTLYINGQAVGTTTGMTLNPASLGATTNNYIGKSQFGNDPYFNGRIDDFRIDSSGLSGAQIASLYDAELAPSVATAAAASPATVNGTTTQLSVLGADYGNASFLTYTWSAVNPPAPVSFSANGTNAAQNTTATFTQSGTYNFIASISDYSGRTVSSLVTVTVAAAPMGIRLAPSPAAVTVNGSVQFSATVNDQFGIPLSSQPAIAWTMAAGSGAVSSSGLYTAPASAGSATVQAAAGSLVATAAVTVTTQSAPTVVNAASASPSPAGTSTALSVLGNSSAGASSLTYTWSVSGTSPGPVTFSVNGSNAAKNTTAAFTAAGTYNFLVTITDNVGLSTTSAVSVPVSFGLFSNSVDIGAPSPAGSLGYNVSSGVYTATGGGADIWGASDQFHYSYESFSGNGQITARVTSISNSNAWAKVGPMFRDGTAANGAFADMVVTPGSGVSFQWRSTDGGNPGFAQLTGVAVPVWLRLIQTGNQFSGYYSNNGTTWTQVGTTQTVSMGATDLAGLAVTSHNQGTATTAAIGNVSVNATPSVAVAASATPLVVVVGKNAQLTVLGADSGGESNLTYTWSMKSGPAAVTFSANGTNAAKTTLATFAKAGSYSFTVTIANKSGLSTTSNVSVTVNLAFSSLSISPSAANLTGGAAQQFTATALDQFGQPLATQPTIAWTLPSGLGTLSSGGLYTPPYASGTATVQAASGSYNATATVTFSSEAQWNAATSASWTASGNWKDAFIGAALAAPGVRGITGDTVLFASAAGATASLDGANPALAGITFNNATTSYTLAQGSGGSLTLQGSGGATVSVVAGSHAISAPVHLASNTTVSPAASTALTISGAIDGSAGLTMAGGGTLVLSGANTFSGGLVVQSGTVLVEPASGLPNGGSLTVGAAGAFNSPVVAAVSAAATVDVASLASPSAIGAGGEVSGLPSPVGRGAGGEGLRASAPASAVASRLSPRAVAAVMAAKPNARSLPLWIRRAAASVIPSMTRPDITAPDRLRSVNDFRQWR